MITTGVVDVPALGRMADAMTTRGPDGEGIWHDDEAGLAFRRLAIIDLNERSNQPLHLGEKHLVFNGEIYNYIELRERLRGLGHRFVTEGDGEVLLHAWAQWGAAALDRLNGMFAFAIWDAGARELTLAVDRFAEKPLLFAERRDGLLFASSVSALRAADPSVGVPDETAVERFLALGTMPHLPATFYADIERLPPAHIATWRAGDGVRVRRWWEPARVEVPDDSAAAAARLRELLSESVRLRLRSDVPVGTSLSGGVDSSAILALTASVSPSNERHAFTAAFPGFERDEWRYAQLAARAGGVAEHHSVNPTADELFDDLPDLIAAQEEPFPTTSIYAQWRLMRSAREQGVEVLLDGQGADELFAGYPGSAGWALRGAGIRAALSELIRNPGVARSVGVAYASGRVPETLARRYRARIGSPYVAAGTVEAAASHAAEEWVDWAQGERPLRGELITEAFRTSLPQLCRFADRSSMAFSVEVRLPFLDQRVAEFALSLPPEMLWRGGVSKRVLRDCARGMVPDAVLDRRDKVAYETPQELWLGSAYGRARVAEILLDEGSRGAHARAEVERDLAAGAWRDSGAIWRAVNTELWLAALTRAPTAAISR